MSSLKGSIDGTGHRKNSPHTFSEQQTGYQAHRGTDRHDAQGRPAEPVPSLDRNKIWRWQQTDRTTLIEFLTPSFEEEEGLRDLPALGVSAQCLHHLNFLIACGQRHGDHDRPVLGYRRRSQIAQRHGANYSSPVAMSRYWQIALRYDCNHDRLNRHRGAEDAMTLLGVTVPTIRPSSPDRTIALSRYSYFIDYQAGYRRSRPLLCRSDRHRH
ncbi:GSU2403 family nucleotidyltransferase fold protein [Fodinicurvata sp. EGI_FJ10296]|uniref:GSU2403 family nucleotidyltransferase fold protein n=1 Tax=Fodinicurvata sp. EGI_FJ10296 TaxID=3231908 RepID=UPI003452CFBE